MNYLKEFTILCLCLFLGVVTRQIIDFPIPEAVYGMIYLFLALSFKIVKPEQIKTACDGILHNLALLFVPVAAGIMASYDIIRGKILLLLLILVVGTSLTMAFTGMVVQFLQRRKKDVRK